MSVVSEAWWCFYGIHDTVLLHAPLWEHCSRVESAEKASPIDAALLESQGMIHLPKLPLQLAFVSLWRG